MDVGTRIREHREAAGMHQDQLAELCHVSRQTISNWERNKTLPDIVSLKVIAHELGTTVDALIGDDIPEIKRQADTEARRFLVLFVLNFLFLLLFFMTSFGQDFGGAFTSPLWMYLDAVTLGAWLVVSIPYLRFVKRHKLWYYGDVARYFEKNLVLEDSRVTRVAHFILKHFLLLHGVFVTLAILIGLACGGVLTPLLAVIIIGASAALGALGVHRDKERQRWGGSVNPPLPPQR